MFRSIFMVVSVSVWCHLVAGIVFRARAAWGINLPQVCHVRCMSCVMSSFFLCVCFQVSCLYIYIYIVLISVVISFSIVQLIFYFNICSNAACLETLTCTYTLHPSTAPRMAGLKKFFRSQKDMPGKTKVRMNAPMAVYSLISLINHIVINP